MQVDEQKVRRIIQETLREIMGPGDQSALPGETYRTMGAAVAAAKAGFKAFQQVSLEKRREMIARMREAILAEVDAIAELAVNETGLGRVDDKKVKNRLAAEKTPGVEDIEPTAYTDDDGLTLMEKAPYGVIGAITPSTNPTETVISNGIGMIAAGNAVVFNPHPSAAKCTQKAIGILRRAIREVGGPPDVICTIADPTIESATEMMEHPNIALLCVTGGPGVVRAAMTTQKKVIAAGPGNPPVVVDETADIPKAARDIVMGASFDNNIVCTDEKEVLVVKSVADELKQEMKKHGAVELSPEQTRVITAAVIANPGSEGKEGSANKQFVGKDAAVLASLAGLQVPAETRLLICEVDASHPLVWTEQLMPILPIVRFDNAAQAIDFAYRVEHGFRHTASIHSKNIDNLSKMAKLMNCSLFVKNGSNFNGLGAGGPGFASYTIAGPTGEGFTRPRTFTRERRCALIGSFRIV
ncbi:MAG: aldehyde dehydrogenase family protein [bacterium]